MKVSVYFRNLTTRSQLVPVITCEIISEVTKLSYKFISNNEWFEKHRIKFILSISKLTRRQTSENIWVNSEKV